MDEIPADQSKFNQFLFCQFLIFEMKQPVDVFG